MEFRKLISFGKSSFVISLPKDWIEKNKLEKGNNVSLQYSGDDLILSSKTEKEDIIEVINLDISGLDSMGKRAIGAAYKAGYDQINISFATSEQLQNIQDVLNDSCIGFEIINQETKSVIAKKISKDMTSEFDGVLRRTFLFLKSMTEDSLEAIKKQDKEALRGIIIKDAMIDKFTDFCRRVLNKSLYKNKKMSPLYCIIENLEKVGDIYADICEELYNKNLKLSKEVLDIYEDLNDFFAYFYDLFYKFDLKNMRSFGELRKNINKKLNDRFDKTPKQEIRVLFYLQTLSDMIFNMNGPLMSNKL